MTECSESGTPAWWAGLLPGKASCKILGSEETLLEGGDVCEIPLVSVLVSPSSDGYAHTHTHAHAHAVHVLVFLWVCVLKRVY